ncbi:hypothetical protein HN840_01945 [archaeon]|nr:hypothetical protein [archaeon]MBT3730483.1 hypothetical protein [archaeon]MBT4669451.1 hypothetical protein [archaeon]MBT5029796.1 hypothetical protein [archaeon]MBT5288009.1 hypothetical protein [archaeon]
MKRGLLVFIVLFLLVIPLVFAAPGTCGDGICDQAEKNWRANNYCAEDCEGGEGLFCVAGDCDVGFECVDSVCVNIDEIGEGAVLEEVVEETVTEEVVTEEGDTSSTTSSEEVYDNVELSFEYYPGLDLSDVNSLLFSVGSVNIKSGDSLILLNDGSSVDEIWLYSDGANVYVYYNSAATNKITEASSHSLNENLFSFDYGTESYTISSYEEENYLVLDFDENVQSYWDLSSGEINSLSKIFLDSSTEVSLETSDQNSLSGVVVKNPSTNFNSDFLSLSVPYKTGIVSEEVPVTDDVTETEEIIKGNGEEKIISCVVSDDIKYNAALGVYELNLGERVITVEKKLDEIIFNGATYVYDSRGEGIETPSFSLKEAQGSLYEILVRGNSISSIDLALFGKAIASFDGTTMYTYSAKPLNFLIGKYYLSYINNEFKTCQLEGSKAECSDGVDNDEDGFVDFTGGCDINNDNRIEYKCWCDIQEDRIPGDDEWMSAEYCEGYNYMCADLKLNPVQSQCTDESETYLWFDEFCEGLGGASEGQEGNCVDENIVTTGETCLIDHPEELDPYECVNKYRAESEISCELENAEEGEEIVSCVSHEECAKGEVCNQELFACVSLEAEVQQNDPKSCRMDDNCRRSETCVQGYCMSEASGVITGDNPILGPVKGMYEAGMGVVMKNNVEYQNKQVVNKLRESKSIDEKVKNGQMTKEKGEKFQEKTMEKMAKGIDRASQAVSKNIEKNPDSPGLKKAMVQLSNVAGKSSKVVNEKGLKGEGSEKLKNRLGESQDRLAGKEGVPQGVKNKLGNVKKEVSKVGGVLPGREGGQAQGQTQLPGRQNGQAQGQDKGAQVQLPGKIGKENTGNGKVQLPNKVGKDNTANAKVQGQTPSKSSGISDKKSLSTKKESKLPSGVSKSKSLSSKSGDSKKEGGISFNKRRTSSTTKNVNKPSSSPNSASGNKLNDGVNKPSSTGSKTQSARRQKPTSGGSSASRDSGRAAPSGGRAAPRQRPPLPTGGVVRELNEDAKNIWNFLFFIED